MRKIKCKLYYREEYETPIGQYDCSTLGDPKRTVYGRRFAYEKLKNYFSEKFFNTEEEAFTYGQEQMYLDPELEYDIEILEVV